MIKSFLRTEVGERIEHRDFRHGMEVSQRLPVPEMVRSVVVGDDSGTSTQFQNYVLSGFETDNPSGTIVRVQNGKAIVGYREAGEVVQGAIVSGGEPNRSQDIASYGDGTYGVFVKFDFRDTAFENRIFWNANAATPIEITKSIATRSEENWTFVVESVSPGPEWLRVAEVVKSGVSLTPSDARDFFFEGTFANSHLVVDAEWGGGDDRSATRATDGVFGFRRFVRGMQRQVQDIVGGTGWWAAVPTSLTALITSKLARDGSQDMLGDLTPDASDTRDLGAILKKWRDLFVKNVFADGNIQPTAAGTQDMGGDGSPIPRWGKIWATSLDLRTPSVDNTSIPLNQDSATAGNKGLLNKNGLIMTLRSGAVGNEAGTEIRLEADTAILNAAKVTPGSNSESHTGLDYFTVTVTNTGVPIPANDTTLLIQSFGAPSGGAVNDGNCRLIGAFPTGATISNLNAVGASLGGVSLRESPNDNEIQVIVANNDDSVAIGDGSLSVTLRCVVLRNP